MEYREIILAKITSIISEGHFIRAKNGEIKRILKCCGLGEIYEKNSRYLEPFTYREYNGNKYENENSEYSLFVGLDNIFNSLYHEGKNELILRLLKEIAENLNPELLQVIQEDAKLNRKVQEFKSLYELLGLSINIDEEHIEVSHMIQSSESRMKDIFSIEDWLFKNYKEVYDSYEGAITAYKNGNVGTCIESCRTTLTSIFSIFKGPDEYAKWKRGIANISDEMEGKEPKDLKKEISKLNKKTLAEFFGENIEGEFKKTKAIYMIYSMMSDYGTHRGENAVEKPSQEDALMMLRMTEDILTWIFMKTNNSEG